MKFGKLDQVDAVDFNLQDPIFLIHEMEREPQAIDQKKRSLYLGGTGWSHSHWKGKLYPAKTASTNFLTEYGKQFNSIELNTTHYRIPPPEMVTKWAKSVPDDFRFAPKLLQYISHSRMLGTDTDRIDRFCERMRYFGQKLGPSFLQLGPHFSPEKLSVLEAFLDAWPIDMPLSIELRHPDWFKPNVEMEFLLGILSERNVGLVITDVAGRRDVAHPYFLADHVIIRFGGNFPHKSDAQRLKDWSSLISQSFEIGMKSFYFFSHQQNANAPAIVRDLKFLQSSMAIQNMEVASRHPKLIPPPATLF